MPRPIAYLRKSRVTSDRHVSWEVQEREVRELAARNGHADVELLSDWGRSGRGDKTRLRPGFARLKEMVAGGEVDVVYSYSLSRLARSLTDYAALAELCRDRGVKVRLFKEGEFDYSTANGRLMVNVLASFAQFEAELAQERAHETMAVRLRRGDYIGQPPYGSLIRDGQLVEDPREDVAVILDAYRSAGSYHAAARLLNAGGVRTRRGVPWSDRTVRTVVQRLESGNASPASERGVRPRSPAHRLTRLLVCHCGTPMTATVDRSRGYGPYVAYVCWRARGDASHPRPHKITERRLLPLVQAEADRLMLPERAELEAEQGRHDELLARRRRVLDNYEDGYIERAERDAKVADLDAEMERLDTGRRIVEVPAIDWSAEPETLNAVLSLLFERIELGPDLLPHERGFVWTVPEWRAA